MPRQCRFTAGWMLLVCWSVAGPAAAQPDQDDLRKLFAFASDRTPSGQQAARKYWQGLRAQEPDPRLDYAYALVLAQQRQFQPALKVLDHLLEQQEDDLAVHRTKIWIEVQVGQHEAALKSMLRLASKFPPAAVNGETAKPWRDAADFLGCMIGYLAGPLATKVDQQQLVAQEEQILKAIGPAQQASFDEGRKAVTDHYEQLVLDLERLEREFRIEEEKRLESHQKKLDHEQERVDEAKQAVLQKSQSLAGERNDLLEAERELAAARVDYANAEAVTQRLFVQLELLNEEQRQLEDDIDVDGMNSAAVSGALAQRRMVQQAVYRRQVAVGQQLMRANVELRRLGVRGQQILARRNALIARHQMETAKLQTGARQIVQTQKRIERDQLDKQTSSQNPKIIALRRELISLSTYDPLPVLLERDRVLASLAENP